MRNNYKENSYRNHLRLLSIFLIINLYVCNSSYAQSFLSASGAKIVNSSGSEVYLKGVNLGNWVVQEGWMISQDGNMPGTQGEMKKILYDKGFSDAQVETFYQGWRDNFITKADIDFIASKGFNCVRFPMHYELFLTPTQRAVRNTVIKDKANYSNYKTQLASWVTANTIATDYTVEGYRLIDNLLSWCAANNIYVILDMHAVPGSQGTDEHIADCLSTPNDLWISTVNQDVLNAMWSKISSRYKGNATIAMYDLINEPNNITSATTMASVYQRLNATIRANGDNHLIMLEGNGWGNDYTANTPDKFTPKTNLVYSIHRYDFDGWACPNDINAIDLYGNINQLQYLGRAQTFKNTHSVPVFCGETGLRNYTWMSENTISLSSLGIGFTIWSYKWHTPMSYDYAFGNIPGITPAEINTSADMNLVLENIKFANMAINTNTGFWEAINATPAPPVAVTDVSVSQISASIAINSHHQLTATVAPANANNKTVIWSSSNLAVATVSSTGLVTAIASGTATITAKTQDGNFTATAAIIVDETIQSGFTVYYNFISVFSDKALDVKDVSTTSGANIQQWDLSTAGGGSNQRWQLDDAGNGNYYIKVKSTQMCLSLQATSNSDGIKVIQETCNSSNIQKWTLTDLGNDVYNIINVYSSKLLDVTDVSNQNGALIQVWSTNNGGTNQQWKLNQVETSIPTQIVDLKEQDVMSIYPNPASDVLTIKQSTDNNIYCIEIYSMSGKLLLSKQNDLSSEIILNIEHLQEGVYVIKAHGIKGIHTSKLIKK